MQDMTDVCVRDSVDGHNARELRRTQCRSSATMFQERSPREFYLAVDSYVEPGRANDTEVQREVRSLSMNFYVKACSCLFCWYSCLGVLGFVETTPARWLMWYTYGVHGR